MAERTKFDLHDLALCFVDWCIKRHAFYIEMDTSEFHVAFAEAFRMILEDTRHHWSCRIVPHPVHGKSDALYDMSFWLMTSRLTRKECSANGLAFITCHPGEVEMLFAHTELPPWVRDYTQKHFDRCEKLCNLL